MKLCLRLCLPLLALAPPVALAQPKEPTAPSDERMGQVTITNANDGAAVYDDVQGVARITKGLVVTQRGENLIIYAQEAVYDTTQNRVDASGQLRTLTRDSTIGGENLNADFSKRQFTVSGNVIITSHGQNDGLGVPSHAETNKKTIRILCDKVVWEYNKKRSTAMGHVRFCQGNTHGTCNELIYDEAQNIVTLRGNMQLVDDQNRTFIGSDIIFSVDNNIISYPIRTCPNFPERREMSRSSKTHIAFKPPPTLPPELLQSILLPTATEKPVPTPSPDAPAKDESKK